jgi:hypothetical protein
MLATVHHEIDIDLKLVDGSRHAVPRNIPNPMFQGETVHYRSEHGQVTVVFDEPDRSVPPSSFHSPYLDPNGKEKKEIRSSEDPITLSNVGTFLGKCFITPTGMSAQIGWRADSPKSGGDHVVKAHGT